MKLVAKLASGVVVLSDEKYGRTVWVRGRVQKRTRETRRCLICNRALEEEAFRPITNQEGRQERICLDCIAQGVEGDKP